MSWGQHRVIGPGGRLFLGRTRTRRARSWRSSRRELRLASQARWVVAIYVVVEAFTYWYVHRPGGPVWEGDAAWFWILLDGWLAAKMLRGSRGALVASTWLAFSALVFVIVGEIVEDQSAIVELIGLALAQCAVLATAWHRQLAAESAVSRVRHDAAGA